MTVKLMSENLTKKDLFNMRSNSVAMKDVIGKELPVDGYAQVEDVDSETGEVRLFNYILSGGECYAGNSVVIANAMNDLVDYIAEEGGATIKFVPIKTKNRTALTMVIV